jgi:hypothetical protein
MLEYWKQRSLIQGERMSMKFHQADITAGLHYEHYNYNVIIDKVRGDALGKACTQQHQ